MTALAATAPVAVSGSTGSVTVSCPNVVGDSGSGGTAGLVPAPSAGDGAAGKFLKADGTFAVPAGSGGTTGVTGWPNAAWSTGGTFTATTPELLGPTDADMFLSAASAGASSTGRNVTVSGGPGGSTSGAGGAVTVTGGNGSGSTSGAGGRLTLQGGNGSTSSNNNSAGGLLITGGTPSGSGTGDVHIQTGFTNGSGATAQTLGDRFYAASHTLTLSNTSATTQTILQLSVPTSNSGGGCTVFFLLEAWDGATTYFADTGHFLVVAVNKGGTLTANAQGATEIQLSGVALNIVVKFPTVSGTSVNVLAAPTWSGITPTTVRITLSAIAFGKGVTVVPQ